MSVIEQTTRLHRYGHLVGGLVLVCSAATACAQGDAQQFINRSLKGQQFVSKNQLLTPRKAQRAADRAREDMLHGHPESAQKELTCALDIAPNYAVALATVGALKLQAGNLDEAAKAFQQAVEQDPTLGAAQLGAAMVLIAQGKFKESLTPIDRATTLLPSSWLVHLEAGVAHLGVGNTEAALQEVEFAERFAGPDPEGRSGVTYLRAMVYDALKDPDRAMKYLAETINRDPGGYYAALAKRRVERLQVAVTDMK